jgi:hypothetical protein
MSRIVIFTNVPEGQVESTKGGFSAFSVRSRHSQPQLAVDAQQLRLAIAGVCPSEANVSSSNLRP